MAETFNLDVMDKLLAKVQFQYPAPKFNAYHVFDKLCANCYYQVDQTQDAASICCVVCGGKGENRSMFFYHGKACFCHHLHQHHHHKCHLQMLSMQRPTLLQSRMSNPTLAAPQASLQKTVTDHTCVFHPTRLSPVLFIKNLKTNIVRPKITLWPPQKQACN